MPDATKKYFVTVTKRADFIVEAESAEEAFGAANALGAVDIDLLTDDGIEVSVCGIDDDTVLPDFVVEDGQLVEVD
jgi:hypothetical protein